MVYFHEILVDMSEVLASVLIKSQTLRLQEEFEEIQWLWRVYTETGYIPTSHRRIELKTPIRQPHQIDLNHRIETDMQAIVPAKATCIIPQPSYHPKPSQLSQSSQTSPLPRRINSGSPTVKRKRRRVMLGQTPEPALAQPSPGDAQDRQGRVSPKVSGVKGVTWDRSNRGWRVLIVKPDGSFGQKFFAEGKHGREGSLNLALLCENAKYPRASPLIQ